MRANLLWEWRVNAVRWLMGAWAWIALAGLAQAHTCVKTVRWFDDPPYTFRTSSGEIQGFYAELARVTLRQMGCTPQFVEMPWARALLELEKGRLDILPGALYKPQREAFAYFSQPINRSPNVLFMGQQAADKYHITQLADLIGTDFRLGAQIGVAYGSSFDALLNNPAFKARVTFVTLRRSAWHMVSINRLDGLISDEVTGLMELQQLGLSQAIARTQLVVSGGPAMFAFSKKSNTPDVVQGFNTAFAALLADGQYKHIAERYLPCAVSVDKLGCI